MSGFDRFLKDIGATTAPEGTSADGVIPEVIKGLRVRLQEMSDRSPDFSKTMDFDLVQHSLDRAGESVDRGDFEQAYRHTLDAVIHLGYAARLTEPVEGLEAVINQAFDEAHQSVR
jgi:hypothetical protein